VAGAGLRRSVRRCAEHRPADGPRLRASRRRSPRWVSCSYSRPGRRRSGFAAVP